ncbi:MAG: hypothetical protein RL115_2297 [Bacteroidota bacterium]
MCNFYGHKVSRMENIKLKQIIKQLGTAEALQELQRMRNGFEYVNAPILRKSAPNDVEVLSAHWEFIPSWITNVNQLQAARKQGIPWLNARSETMLASNMFKDAVLNRRCLVPASHFFEWRAYTPPGVKKEIKYPYAIELSEADYFYMAGIYNSYINPQTGIALISFAIVTTAANALMQEVHNQKKRMPTILPDELAWRWVMDDLSEEAIKAIATYQLPAASMKAYTIAKNFKAADDPLTPFHYEGLPPLAITESGREMK